MHSTLAPTETDPHDIFVIEPDVVLAARADTTSSNPAHEARVSPPLHPTAPDAVAGSAPSLDAALRIAAVDNIKVPRPRPPIGRWARRALAGFLLALCSGVAADGWTHYGEAAKAMAEQWTPKFLVALSPPQQTPAAAAQPGSPALQTAAADQAAPPAQSAPSATPPVATLPAESAQLLQSMSQQIEQLKASVEQLKTSQEQMSRDIARNSETKTVRTEAAEHTLRPKPPVPALRSVAAALARKPKPAASLAPVSLPAQAAALPPLPPQIAAAPLPPQPQPPAQATTESEFGPVMRPPMPMR
jgi:hypothetical protein